MNPTALKKIEKKLGGKKFHQEIHELGTLDRIQTTE